MRRIKNIRVLLAIFLVFSLLTGPFATVTARAEGSGTWKYSSSKWWYSHADGSYTVNGWEKIDGEWYHFDSKGWMQTGWLKDGSVWYYLESSGKMAHDKWVGNYYLTSSGAMAVNRWIGQYYVGADGKWVPGAKKQAPKAQWLKDSTGWWYRHADGSYTRNDWEKIDGKWYHFDSKGYMQTGWLQDGGAWYFLDGDGSMAHDTWVGTYYLSSSGVMVESGAVYNPDETFLVVTAEGPKSMDKFPAVDIIVIDADNYTAAQIAALKAKGIKTVLSYFNIGSVENYRSYYNQFVDITLDEYENWPDERWVDVSQTKWQEFMKQRAEGMAAKGIDGFFIDNMDVYTEYPREGIYKGLVNVLSHLHGLNKMVMINGGELFSKRYLKTETAKIFDAVALEDVYTKYNFSNNTCGVRSAQSRTYKESYLDLVVENNLKAYIIEFATDSKIQNDIYRYAKSRGYGCYVADNIGLKLNKELK